MRQQLKRRKEAKRRWQRQLEQFESLCAAPNRSSTLPALAFSAATICSETGAASSDSSRSKWPSGPGLIVVARVDDTCVLCEQSSTLVLVLMRVQGGWTEDVQRRLTTTLASERFSTAAPDLTQSGRSAVCSCSRTRMHFTLAGGERRTQGQVPRGELDVQASTTRRVSLHICNVCEPNEDLSEIRILFTLTKQTSDNRQ